jgi:Trm5-related predicted tRNA methylase
MEVDKNIGREIARITPDGKVEVVEDATIEELKTVINISAENIFLAEKYKKMKEQEIKVLTMSLEKSNSETDYWKSRAKLAEDKLEKDRP